MPSQAAERFGQVTTQEDGFVLREVVCFFCGEFGRFRVHVPTEGDAYRKLPDRWKWWGRRKESKNAVPACAVCYGWRAPRKAMFGLHGRRRDSTQ